MNMEVLAQGSNYPNKIPMTETSLKGPQTILFLDVFLNDLNSENPAWINVPKHFSLKHIS